MFYTITFNPAIDYIMKVKNFNIGEINRSHEETLFPGGKGINISSVLSSFGIDNIAFGFKGGFTGEELERLLKERNVKTDFIKLKNGNTRINIKLKSHLETDINSNGPEINSEEIDMLFKKLTLLKENDYLILSGSIPGSLSKNIYYDIAEYISKKKVNLVVDAERELLTNILEFSPFIIKPNKKELEEIIGERLDTDMEIAQAALYLKEKGAKNVFVSLGERGGLFATQNNEVFLSPAPKGTLINSTGAGDSALAGFLAEYEKEKDLKKAFIMGIATGSACAFSLELGTYENALRIYSKMSKNTIIQMKI